MTHVGKFGMAFRRVFFRNVAAAPGVEICDRQNIIAILRELGRIDERREPKSTYSIFLILVRHCVGTGGGRYGLLILKDVPALESSCWLSKPYAGFRLAVELVAGCT